jgi:hypothetical protein
VEYFSYVGSVTTDARCTRETRSEIAIQQKEGSFHQQTVFN